MAVRKILLALIFSITSLGAAHAQQGLHWSDSQARQLVGWLNNAPADGLPDFSGERAQVEQALAAHNQGWLDVAATGAAMALLDRHRDGCCSSADDDIWHIAHESFPAATASVAEALTLDDIDGLFGRARPRHPAYVALSAALARESDPARRARLILNMDRWRRMPRDPGRRYVLVNSAAFEAALWQDGQEVAHWPVIVGKLKSPTPVFAAKITGVIFNPWWEIPTSIVAESVGRLVRNSPALAARRGYVIENGRYRQRPGPGNALGQMKLAMPNPYSVYLHDTPSRSLFAQPVRAFSHGCVRVGDALDFATSLLATRPGWTRQDSDATVATGRTQTVDLGEPIPIYIAYFTAEPDRQGGVRELPDIYGRDD